MSQQIFISYKAEEIEKARLVKEYFEKCGYDCWLAPDSIPGGSSYANEIENAINTCEAFVIILSRFSMSSKWVERELDRAINAGKLILPFKTDESEITPKFSFYLSCVQMYNAFVDWNGELEKMISDIKENGIFPINGDQKELPLVKNTDGTAKIENALSKTWPEWQICEKIGKGSIGTVYKIKRLMRGKIYFSALKVIEISRDLIESELAYSSAAEAYQDWEERLSREIELMYQVKGNSNIVSYEDHKIIRFENDEGFMIFIRMELLTPLSIYLKSNTLQENDIRKIGIELCDALSFCEKKGIIHGDIKPENVFVTSEGTYKLGDFSAAKIVGLSKSTSTQSGTALFMAPEVYKNERYDYRADQYSLGLLLYYLLNNNNIPFYSNSGSVLTDISKANRERLQGSKIIVESDCDRGLADAIEKSCEYKANSRFSSIEEFKTGLQKTNEDLHIIKRKKKKSILAVTISMVAVTAIVLIGLYMYKEANKFKSDKVLYEGDMCKITLTPDEDLSLKDYASDVEIVKSRMNILAEGQEFLVENNDDNSIDIYSSESMWNFGELSTVLEQYISSPSDIYLYDAGSAITSPSYFKKIDKEYIKDVSVITGKIPEYSEETEYEKYYKIEISEEFISDSTDFFSKYGEDVNIGMDVRNNPWFSFDGCFSEDYTCYYYPIDKDTDENLINLFVNNLKTESLRSSFILNIDYRTFAVWDEFNEGKVKGQNQCDFCDLDEDMATVGWNLLMPTEGQLSDAEKSLKERLDSLGESYAFGRILYDNNAILMASLSPEVIDKTLAEGMIKNNSSLCFDYTENDSLSISADFFTDNDKVTMNLTEDIKQKIKEDKAEKLYFCIERVPYLEADISDIGNMNSVVFSNDLNGVPYDESDYTSFVSLVNTIINGSTFSGLASVYFFQYSSENVENIKPSYSNELFLEKITDDITDKFGVEKCVLSSNSMSIVLDYKVDSNLPQKMCDFTKEIIDYTNIENNFFVERISVYFVDEDKDDMERVRMFIDKAKYGDKAGTVTVNGMFANGRMVPYIDDFLKLVNSDPYFVEHAAYENDSWITQFGYSNGVYSGS